MLRLICLSVIDKYSNLNYALLSVNQQLGTIVAK